MKGLEVQLSEDGNEVCIIPRPYMPMQDFRFICDYYAQQGFDKWVASDERGGHRFVKETKIDKKSEKKCCATLE